MSSWDFYIVGHDEWLKKPLAADKNGILVGNTGTEISKFSKGTPIQILNLALESVKGQKLAKVKVGSVTGWTKISYITKPTTLQRTTQGGGRVQERQEFAVNDAINEAVAANAGNPVNVQVGLVKAGLYKSSNKNEGTSKLGHEKYADLIWTPPSGKWDGVSMKIGVAPSMFGGGYIGLYNLDKNYVKHISDKAFKAALHDDRFELGSSTKLVDIFVQITSNDFKKKAFTGNADMGGPVKYIFVGPSSPKYTLKGSTITFTDSHLYTSDTYFRAHPKFYIRIRRRNATDVFTDAIGPDGIPLIFTVPGGTKRARYVVTESAPATALILDDK